MLVYLTLFDSQEEKLLFQEIYKSNFLKMFHVSLGILKNKADAENAVHEAFLALAEKFENYSSLSSQEMTGLRIIIVKNKSIDMIRKQQHISETELEELVIYNQNIEFQPAEHILQEEEEKRIQHIISQLPDVLQTTMELKYIYGYNNREIAKMLGVPVKTVEMRIYRGKIKLREILKNEKTDR